MSVTPCLRYTPFVVLSLDRASQAGRPVPERTARLQLPCASSHVFGSRKSRGTAEFVTQSRSGGRTLISDSWMSCGSPRSRTSYD